MSADHGRASIEHGSVDRRHWLLLAACAALAASLAVSAGLGPSALAEWVGQGVSASWPLWW